MTMKIDEWKHKDFLKLSDYTSEEISFLLDEALDLKKKLKNGEEHAYLKGKTLGMIFEKSSTRTRVSFEVGMYQLGGQGIFLSSRDIQIGRGESIHDTAKVLSRYLDGMIIRTFEQEKVEELAKHATVPVINALTDLHHPTQVLADLMTILEHKGHLKGLNLCYIGDGDNNMTHSLIEGAVRTGMNVSIASPQGYEPNKGIFQQMKVEADKNGSRVFFTNDPLEAAENADVITTDVWTSMGNEDETEERLKAFQSYQVNRELCAQAKDDYLFLHCLPAHRGEEVTADIIDGKHSVVFDEAENRLHAHKAILHLLMK